MARTVVNDHRPLYCFDHSGPRGAKLWEQNCVRCHNVRTPSSLSDTQWKVVMHHMRVRAGLTAQEHEAILRFLQSAN